MPEGFRLQGDDETPPVSSLNAMLALGLNTEGADAIDPSEPGERPGDFIRNYRLLDLLGEGGFGTVWRAQQIDPIQRVLALKLIKPGMSSRSIIARFDAERQALAMMDHPNIAAVLDAGATTDGRSFFAMELVRGVPLNAYCDENHLTIRERIELFLPVCDAVQHAHQKGIIHRDLKPSNILVTRCAGKAVPKVIDFGVAKALGSSDLPAFQASMLYTQVGAVVGTLQYMSPEQAGSVPDVDTRSDIYTLGVILYELLIGCTPFDRDQCRNMAFDEALRHVRDGPTSMPSSHHYTTKAHLVKEAGLRQLDPRALKGLLRGDLDWITVKALEKERGRRYATAAALADDLQRYLDGKPVSAVAPTWSYQFRRFASRNRLVITTVTVISLALLAGTGFSVWQAISAKRARAAAEQSRILAEQKSLEAEANLDRARKAVETYLSSVTDDPRLTQADFSNLRKDLLKSALPLYEEMLARTSSPGLRMEQLQARHRLASLYQAQGDYHKAEELNQETLAKLQALVDQDPDNLKNLRLLQQSYNVIGSLYSDLGQREKSVDCLEQAVKVARRISGKSDEHADIHLLSNVLSNLGVSYSNVGRTLDAEKSYEESLNVERALVERMPQESNYRAQLAVCYTNLAGNLITQGKNLQAEQLLWEAIALQQRLTEVQPENPGHPKFQAFTYSMLGSLKASNGAYEAAIPMFQKAIDLNTPLIGQFPKEVTYRLMVSRYQVSIADMLLNLNRTPEGIARLRTAGELLLDLARDYPAAPEFPGQAGIAFDRLGWIAANGDQWDSAYQDSLTALRAFAVTKKLAPTSKETAERYLGIGQALIRACLRTGRIVEATQWAKDHLEQSQRTGMDYRFTAAAFARAAELLSEDASISPENRPAIADTYRQQAVECLREMIRIEGKKDYGLETAEDLLSLRDYTPFINLLQGR